jgi:hypothetical protein
MLNLGAAASFRVFISFKLRMSLLSPARLVAQQSIAIRRNLLFAEAQSGHAASGCAQRYFAFPK